MTRPNRIPLFPLDVVLLPGAQLPLHIFEPRYKIMIAKCLDEKLEFGMILGSNGAVATVGCTAEITQKLKEYPDGRTDILTEGRAVFQLKELLDEKEYYEGNVEYVADNPFRADAEKDAQLTESFDKCHALLFGRPWRDAAPDDAAILAYRIAAMLPMELDKRQTLLEMRSESDRREMVLHWIESFLPKLAERQQARKRASGNGHALN
ncbi:MAG TPA: LON peptidase substrate-binding domain-containing protein [Candidatus Acidoferrales bacterium]|nr:LON peptidase substrate-binding domain-containing protein [Candidatus Acidoferrales bacterium]